MSTLKEIARAAGVSTTTVSNVINGNYKRVSSDKVERIQALISQLGYVPNQAARSLAQRESRFIAVIVQASEDENAFLNPYNAAFIGSLTVQLYKNGYYPLIRCSDDFATIENDIVGWNVAGAIFNGSFYRHLRHIKSLSGVPCVMTDCPLELTEFNHVSLDDLAGGRVAGSYLAQLGHRRVAFVANILEESEVDHDRLRGLRQSMEASGCTVPDAWVLPNGNFEAQSERLVALLRDPEGPTAFFCSADRLAVSLIRFLHLHGLRVPEDVSVLGFDDLPMASLCAPQLSTIAQNIDQKAFLTVDMLLRHIRDKDLSPERALLGVRLVERESTARPPQQRRPVRD